MIREPALQASHRKIKLVLSLYTQSLESYVIGDSFLNPLKNYQGFIFVCFQCSVTCGHGEMQRRVSCSSGNQNVDITECDLTLMPETVRACEMPGCPIWQVGPWGQVIQDNKFNPTYCPLPSLGLWFLMIFYNLPLPQNFQGALSSRPWGDSVLLPIFHDILLF